MPVKATIAAANNIVDVILVFFFVNKFKRFAKVKKMPVSTVHIEIDDSYYNPVSQLQICIMLSKKTETTTSNNDTEKKTGKYV